MLHFADIALGAGGLPVCRKCGPANDAEPRSSADIVDDVASVVAGWVGPGPNLAFGGMEAFAHPELPDILLKLTDHPIERIRLATAGAPLGAYDNAEGALTAGVRHLELVVLGGQAAHDDLAGAEGGLAAAASGVARYLAIAQSRRLAVAVSGVVPVCRHNMEHVAEAVVELAQMGAVSVVLDVSEAAAKSVQAPSMIAAAVETGVVHRCWVAVRGMEATSFSPLHLLAPATSGAPA